MAESQHKSWLPGRPANANIGVAEMLMAHAAATLAKTRLPVYHFHEGNQVGVDFGQRLGNAFQALFDKGHTAVVAVGNDSPGMADTPWCHIKGALGEGRAVLGPSMRGGAYLIGLTAQQFDLAAFQALPWQTHRLFEALSQYCQSRQDGQAATLPPLRDANNIHDLRRLAKTGTLRRWLKKALRHWLACPFQMPVWRIPRLATALPIGTRALRAPPLR